MKIIGLSHNQLGVIAGFKDQDLDSLYYYMRAASSYYPFPNSLGNVISLLSKIKSRTLRLFVFIFCILLICQGGQNLK